MTTLTNSSPREATSSVTTAGQGGCLPEKWDILRTVEEARIPLGLKGTTINLLRAMISLLRVDRISPTTDDTHICFASNATLAQRTHVSVQTIERHVTKLVRAGLIRRVSSANGKRWARRDRHGKVTLATGLSLMPLVDRFKELQRTAADHVEQEHALHLLRDKCSIALACLKSVIPDHQDMSDFFCQAKNILRRKPDTTVLQNLLKEIAVEISNHSQHEPDILKANDRLIEGHKETDKNQLVVSTTTQSIEVTTSQMENAYPRLCTELRFAKSHHECSRIMDDLAKQLALKSAWEKTKEKGPTLAFLLLGYILERVETIKNYQAYLVTLNKRLANGDMAWTSLLTKPKRRDARKKHDNERTAHEIGRV